MAGRPGGRVVAHVAQRDRGPARAARRDPRHARVHVPRGEAVRAALDRADRPADHRVPAPRLAPHREAPALRRPRGRRGLGLGVARGLRAVLLPQRARARRARPWTVLLPAQARGLPRGTRLERRVRVRAGVPGDRAGHHPCDRARRDPARRVRDGGDPPRAARPLRRAQRGPLGLPVLGHQVVPHARRPVRPARPRAGAHDRSVHAGLHRAPRRDVPQARGARDRRHERVHPRPTPTRRDRRRRSSRSARTSGARPATGSTAPGSRTPTSSLRHAPSSTPSWATARTRSRACATT